MEKDKINLFEKYTKNINKAHFMSWSMHNELNEEIKENLFPQLMSNQITLKQFELLCKKEIKVFITKLDTLKAMLERSL